VCVYVNPTCFSRVERGLFLQRPSVSICVTGICVFVKCQDSVLNIWVICYQVGCLQKIFLCIFPLQISLRTILKKYLGSKLVYLLKYLFLSTSHLVSHAKKIFLESILITNYMLRFCVPFLSLCCERVKCGYISYPPEGNS
jgi:hypothetical protein